MDVVNNKEHFQFQITLEDGEKAVLEYRWHDKDLTLMHTFVPPAHEGKGVAALLAKEALEYAKAEGIKVIVYCPYVAAYLKRHPEYKELVAMR